MNVKKRGRKKEMMHACREREEDKNAKKERHLTEANFSLVQNEYLNHNLFIYLHYSWR